MGLRSGINNQGENGGKPSKDTGELRKNEELFRVLSDNSLTATFLIQNNMFVYVNPVAERILGYSKEELLKMHFWEPVHPEYKDQITEYGLSLLHGNRLPGRYEIKFVRKDGEVRWCIVTVAPVTYKGNIAGVVSGMDITERKLAEAALKESEEKFRVLSETSPAAFFLYQGDKLIYVNPAARRFTGYTEEEMLQKNFWDMVHPGFRDLVKSYGLARQSGKKVPTRYEVQYITKGGEVRWAEFSAGYINYRGKPAGIVIAFDITDRKQYEAALVDSMAQSELYVDLMGHDINNLNQVALGYLELALDKLEDGGIRELIEKPIEALEKSSRLIGKVKKLQLMRSGHLKPLIVDVGEVLADVVRTFSRVPGRDIVIDYTPGGGFVMANELLTDVFSNLVVNAIKHSPCDRQLTIGIEVARVREGGEDLIKVSVSDNGPGIPDDKKAGIFGRFSGGLRRTMGSGLGLYLVKSLVESYGGQVRVEDRVPGDHAQGSRFVVMLPAAPVPKNMPHEPYSFFLSLFM